MSLINHSNFCNTFFFIFILVFFQVSSTLSSFRRFSIDAPAESSFKYKRSAMEKLRIDSVSIEIQIGEIKNTFFVCLLANREKKSEISRWREARVYINVKRLLFTISLIMLDATQERITNFWRVSFMRC